MQSRDFSNRQKGETGYSWLYRTTALHSGFRVTVTILIIVVAAVFLAWYSHVSSDVAPDSLVGLIYAILGTLFLLMAGTLYSLRRRSHRHRKLGGLGSSLGWHICFAIIGVALISMHTFGEFNPRTGTYALYGLIALAVSGLIGRLLDRVMPRLVAIKVNQSLTAQGDDRIETISQKIQAIVGYNSQNLKGMAAPPQSKVNGPVNNNSLIPLLEKQTVFAKDQPLHTPWDMAYISLESTPQEVSRDTTKYRFVPDKQSQLLRPGALMPGTQEQMTELEDVRQAMESELFYRYIIRYWRVFHVLLAVVTLGLVIWHIVYALQLMLFPILH